MVTARTVWRALRSAAQLCSEKTAGFVKGVASLCFARLCFLLAANYSHNYLLRACSVPGIVLGLYLCFSSRGLPGTAYGAHAKALFQVLGIHLWTKQRPLSSESLYSSGRRQMITTVNK